MSKSHELKERVQALDDGALQELRGRSMLLTSEWSRTEIETLLSLVGLFESLDDARVSTALFPDELHLAVFFDASTRTKSSWAGAADLRYQECPWSRPPLRCRPHFPGCGGSWPAAGRD